LAGADVATVPFAVLKKMFAHPLTDIGNAKFIADWQTVENNDIVGQVTTWLDNNGRS
jgi:transaldolase